MSNELLLPNKYKLIGLCLLIPVTILGLILSFRDMDTFEVNSKVFAIFNQPLMSPVEFFKIIDSNITPTVVGALFIVAAMMVGFSKEKREDEFIAKVRMSSLLWAVWVNYILLFLSFAFVYGASFLTVMMYNMYTVLIIFIVRFNYILYKNSNSVSDEK